MRAAIIEEPGSAPVVRETAAPDAAGRVATMVAAPLNPVDRIIAGGSMPYRKVAAGAGLGLEGIARLDDGAQAYVFAPTLPFGTFAERVPLDGAEVVEIPAGLDPVTAAALGVPGIAAVLGLKAAGLREGATVLVLGGTGAVGRIAVQAAAHLGAGTVLGTARDDAGLAAVAALGGTPVSVADAAALDADLSRLAPEGVDVVLDLLWGEPFAATVSHLAHGARIAQVGNSAGPDASIVAPVFRNKAASIVGHSNFAVTAAERAEAYATVAGLAAAGDLTVAADAVDFAEFDAVWAGDGPAKPVFVF